MIIKNGELAYCLQKDKIMVSWDVMQHRLVQWHQHFSGTCCRHLQDRQVPWESVLMKMDHAGSSIMLYPYPSDYMLSQPRRH